MEIKKYQIKNQFLEKIIKCFWVVNSANLSINHKLLPDLNIDLILNLSSPIKYTTENKTITMPQKIHFSGIRDQASLVNQSGKIFMIGISFFPGGLYPLIKVPLSEFTNRVIDLSLLNNNLALKLNETLNTSNSVSATINLIENTLLQHIDMQLLTNNTMQICNAFSLSSGNISINEFCNNHGINPRKLERTFNTYVGIRPKLFDRIRKFQQIIHSIINNKYDNFTSLASENYYDQTHFIKDFKSFTGSSPSQFIKHQTTVKQMIAYT